MHLVSAAIVRPQIRRAREPNARTMMDSVIIVVCRRIPARPYLARAFAWLASQLKPADAFVCLFFFSSSYAAVVAQVSLGFRGTDTKG